MAATPRHIESFFVSADIPFFKSMNLAEPEVWTVQFNNGLSIMLDLIAEGNGIRFRCFLPIDLYWLPPSRHQAVLQVLLQRNCSLLKGRYGIDENIVFEYHSLVGDDEPTETQINAGLGLVADEVNTFLTSLFRIAYRNNSTATTEQASENLAENFWDWMNDDELGEDSEE